MLFTIEDVVLNKVIQKLTICYNNQYPNAVSIVNDTVSINLSSSADHEEWMYFYIFVWNCYNNTSVYKKFAKFLDTHSNLISKVVRGLNLTDNEENLLDEFDNITRECTAVISPYTFEEITKMAKDHGVDTNESSILQYTKNFDRTGTIYYAHPGKGCVRAAESVKYDRAILKRLVESYGKEDVLKYVNHINEMGYFNKSTRLPRPSVLVAVDVSGSMYETLQNLNIDFVKTFRINPSATSQIEYFSDCVHVVNERTPVSQLNEKIKEHLEEGHRACMFGGTDFYYLLNEMVNYSSYYDMIIIITDQEIVQYDEIHDITWAVEAIEDNARLIIYDAENSEFLTDELEDVEM